MCKLGLMTLLIFGGAAMLGTATSARAAGVDLIDWEKETVVVLWPDGAPGAIGTERGDIPALALRLAPEDKATGAAVVVCPGGGYGHLAMGHEGDAIANWYNEAGIHAFILRYRIAPRYHHPAPLTDAQRAVRTVRARAEEWGVDPDRIGIMGFSAGGHLASSAITHFDDGALTAKDKIERVSCRPDFAVLCYPVISLTTEYCHVGSRRNLLGPNPPEGLAESLSPELQVARDTPPTFLFHTSDDKGVPSENSVLFYLALRKAGVPAEMHIYEPGRHGLGLAQDHPALKTWPDLCLNWLRVRGVLPADK